MSDAEFEIKGILTYHVGFCLYNFAHNLYDTAGRKYKSIVYTTIASAHSQQYDFANYSLETDSLYCKITEYSGNIETYTIQDMVTTTRQRIFNNIGYHTDGAYYHYVKDHLGNICAVVNSVQDTAVQSTLYYASGVPLARSSGREEQPYLYNGKEFIEAHGLNEYDSQARMYYPVIMRTTTMDPLAEKYYHISPYAWCGNNPMAFVDPDGMAWYLPSGYPAPNTEKAHERSGEQLPFQWTECKSQEEMDKAGLNGVYYGEAVVVFNGYEDEHLGIINGERKYLGGDDAKLAEVTLYGPKGSDDITIGLRGFTMTSNYEKYGAIDDGIWWANYDVVGMTGRIESHWVLNNRGMVPTFDYQPNPNVNASDMYGTMYKNGIFIHSTVGANNRVGSETSKGCLLLDWKSMHTFNEKMEGVRYFSVQVTRR